MEENNTQPETDTEGLTKWFKTLGATLRGTRIREQREQREQQARQLREEENDHKERQKIIKALEAIYQGIKDDGSDTFDSNDLRLNNVVCDQLPLDALDKPPTWVSELFFIPMTKEEMDQHLRDLSDKETKRYVENCMGTLWEVYDYGPARQAFF
jgi:hypothetical protein